MKKSTFFKDFKEFITKGNIIDMAVGVVIGGSFGKIVTGLVENIINPFVGMFMKTGDLANWKTVMEEAVLDEAGNVVTPEVAVNYGNFIQNVVDFVIIAFCIFVMIKLIMNLKRKKEEPVQEPAPAPAPEPTNEEKLLTEIRDLLKENNAKK